MLTWPDRQYNFDLAPTGSDPRQQTSTLHDGINYSLFIYPLPACAATSIAQLAGKELPYQTWLNTMAWDKRRQVQTLSWDYEHGTMFANQRYFSYTVFQHTHTCYEYCDQWFTYWYVTESRSGYSTRRTRMLIIFAVSECHASGGWGDKSTSGSLN